MFLMGMRTKVTWVSVPQFTDLKGERSGISKGQAIIGRIRRPNRRNVNLNREKSPERFPPPILDLSAMYLQDSNEKLILIASGDVKVINY